MEDQIKSMTMKELFNLRADLLIKRMSADSKKEWDKLATMSDQVATEIESR